MTLVDSLDLQRSKTKALYVNVLMKNRKDVSSLIVLGLIMITIGFGVYYFLPLSLVSFNFSLASSIFLCILFGMILALGLFSMNVMPFINVIVTRLTLIFEDKNLKSMTLKNLIAHRDRN